MKIFANRSIWKKMVIIFSLIFSMSFVEPASVKAGIGGTLMEPVCDLLVGLGDGFMNVTHHILIGQETTLIKVNLKDGAWGILRIVVTIFAVAIALAAAAMITAGGAIAIGWIITHLGGIAATGIVGSAIMANIVPIAVFGVYVGVKAYNSDAFVDEVDLPLYSISPERIFSNTIPFFDVNFFNPNSAPFKYEWVHKTTTEEYAQQTMTANGKYTQLSSEEILQLNLNFSQGTTVVTDQLKKELKNYNITDAVQIEVNGTKYVQYNEKVRIFNRDSNC